MKSPSFFFRIIFVCLVLLCASRVVLAQGFSLEETITHSSCVSYCNGSIVTEYSASDPTYEPTSFRWYLENSDEVYSSDSYVYDLCPGTYRLSVEFSMHAPYEEFFTIEATPDITPPNTYLDWIHLDIAENTTVSGDTLITFDVVCTWSYQDLEYYLDDVLPASILYNSFDCSTLEIIPHETIQGDPGKREILSKKYTLRDYVGNETAVYVAFNLGTVYNPQFNYIEVDGRYYDVSFDRLTENVIVNRNTASNFTADADPVCANNNLEIKWDTNNDGLYEHNTPKITKTFTQYGIYPVKVKAFGKSIGNTQSNDLTFNIEVTGIDVRETISHAGCSDEVGSITLALEYSDRFTPRGFNWTNENGDIISYERDLLYAPPGKYKLFIYFSNDNDFIRNYEILAIDKEKPEIYQGTIINSMQRIFDDNRSPVTFANPTDSVLLIGISCVHPIEKIRNYLNGEAIQLWYDALDNCDDYLSYSKQPIVYTNNKYPNFILSQKFILTDDSGNHSSLDFVFFIENFYSPEIIQLDVGGKQFNVRDLEQYTIYVDENVPVSTEAIIDPVCANSDITIKWDTNHDGMPDKEGPALTHSWAETDYFIVKAFGTVNNGQSIPLRVNAVIKDITAQAVVVADCNNICGGDIFATINSQGIDFDEEMIEWRNVTTGTFLGNGLAFYDVCPGVYSMRLPIEGRETLTSTVRVPEKLSAEFLVERPRCRGENSGSIQISNITGSGGYDLKIYDDSDILISINTFAINLEAGEYRAHVFDISAGCMLIEELVVPEGSPRPTANFTTDEQIIDLSERDFFQFTNHSIGAVEYSWDFGDGETSQTNAPSFSHTYTETGSYTVTLTAHNEVSCSDTFTQTLGVTNILSTDPDPDYAIVAYPNPVVGSILNLQLPEDKHQCTVELWDAMGKQIITYKLTATAKDEVIQLELPPMKTGFYYLHIILPEKTHRVKLLRH